MANYSDDTPELLKDLDRINKMTPDQAYRYSVDSIGRDPSITKQMDAAATIPEDEMQRRRQSAGVANPEKPIGVANQPAGATVTESGVYLPNGKLAGDKPAGYEQMASTQMMEKMNQGLRPKNGLTWEDALKQQQFEKVGRSLAIAQQKVDQNNELLATRQRRKTLQNIKVADNIQMATSNLAANLANVQKHLANGGGIEESGAYLSKDGSYYVRGIVAPSMVDDFNRDMAKLGGKDALQKIVVSQKINKTTGEPDGEPTYSALYMKDGIGGQGSGRYPKTMTLSEALRHVEKAYLDNGMPKDRVAGQLAGVFGEANAAKYGYAAKPSEKPASVQAAEIRAKSAAEVANANNETKKWLVEQKSKDDKALAEAKNLSETQRNQAKSLQEKIRGKQAQIRTMMIAMGDKSASGAQSNRYSQSDIDAANTELSEMQRQLDALLARQSSAEPKNGGQTQPSNGYNGNSGEFKELSPEDFHKLSPEDQAKYREAWKKNRQAQKK